MTADANSEPEPEEGPTEKKPLPFGQNLLGIKFLADDWEKDIPLEYFQHEGEENPFGGESAMDNVQVNLYEAKTQLSSLVDRAAKGEEIVIAKAGKPMAKLVPVTAEPKVARTPGRNLLGITYMAEDFDAPLPEDVLQDFGL
ncbi:MAG: type II toxin-antitoxin system prevent-host-death family antitoxin [Terracidiphilus sp.]